MRGWTRGPSSRRSRRRSSPRRMPDRSGRGWRSWARRCSSRRSSGWTRAPSSPRSQDHTTATYAPKLLPEERTIDWARPADAIVRRSALAPDPGAFTMFRQGRLKGARRPTADPGGGWMTAADSSVPGVDRRGRLQPADPGHGRRSWSSSRSRRPAASGCPAKDGRAERGSNHWSDSDEPERPAGGPRGHPPRRRRRRVLEPHCSRPPSDAPAWTSVIARSRPSSPTGPCDTFPSWTRRSARAPRDRSPEDDAGRTRRAPSRRVPAAAHADPGPCGGRRDRRRRRPQGARVRERDPSPAGEGAARSSRKAWTITRSASGPGWRRGRCGSSGSSCLTEEVERAALALGEQARSPSA